MKRLLLAVLFALSLPVFAQSQVFTICSGGQIACDIPGATFNPATSALTLPGALTVNGNMVATGFNSTNGQTFLSQGLVAAPSIVFPDMSGFFDRGTSAAVPDICWSAANNCQFDFEAKVYTIPRTGCFAFSASTTNAASGLDAEFCDGGGASLIWALGSNGNENTLHFGDSSHRILDASITTMLSVAYATTGGVVTESLITPTSCTGSGCAIQAGSLNSVGTVTTTTTGVATITIAFSITAANGSSCQAQNETTANILKPTSTTTALVITGTTVAGDKISYQCKFF